VVETPFSEREFGGLLTVAVEVATLYTGLLDGATCQELTVFCHSLTSAVATRKGTARGVRSKSEVWD
jgi:hypothetical protein